MGLLAGSSNAERQCTGDRSQSVSRAEGEADVRNLTYQHEALAAGDILGIARQPAWSGRLMRPMCNNLTCLHKMLMRPLEQEERTDRDTTTWSCQPQARR